MVLLPIFLDALVAWVVAVVPNRLLVVLQVVLPLLPGILRLLESLLLLESLHLQGIFLEILLLRDFFCWVNCLVGVE